MRLRSTPTSVSRGEITFLAVAECFLSVAIYAFIGWYLETWLHLVVAVSCAPLFLFRTKYSSRLALGWWKKLWQWPDRLKKETTQAIVVIPLLLMGIIVRAGSTAIGVMKHPKWAVVSIPGNWVRQALVTDILYVPEIIPGESLDKEAGDAIPSFSSLLEGFSDAVNIPEEKITHQVLMWTILLCALLFCYIPAIFLRISFKASSFVYLPLVFVAASSRLRKSSLQWKLERITKGELESARRKVSFLVLTLAAGRAGLQQGLVEPGFFRDKLGSEALAQIVLSGWPWWFSTLIIEAALTFMLFFSAGWALSRIERRQPLAEDAVMSAFMGALFVRGALASITVIYLFCLAFITLALHVATST
jgi:hypothetical protein